MLTSTACPAPRARRVPRAPLVALVALAGLVLAGAGCHDHRRDFDDDPEVFVTVHNLHGDTIFVQLEDDHGNIIDLGTIRDGREVVLGLDDSYIGNTLRARCTCDGETVDVEFAYDGLHWDVF